MNVEHSISFLDPKCKIFELNIYKVVFVSTMHVPQIFIFIIVGKADPCVHSIPFVTTYLHNITLQNIDCFLYNGILNISAYKYANLLFELGLCLSLIKHYVLTC